MLDAPDEVTQVKETSDLLTIQVDALIKRVAAKDDDFAKERRVWKRTEAAKDKRIRELERELRELKRPAKRGGLDGVR